MFKLKAIDRWLGGAKPAPASAARVPDQVIAYAIGDIHGRADLLDPLLRCILQDFQSASGKRMLIVALGDYIDRGPASKDVIDQLLALKAAKVAEMGFVRGNHDQTLLDFLEDPSAGPAWVAYGGGATLASYGVTPLRPTASPEECAAASKALAEALPPAHLAFFRELDAAIEVGDYFFTHAGCRPGVALDDQNPRDLMWIREPFLTGREVFPKVVVHGHTPAEAAHADHRRIGLDTGAYATGVLSAVRLEGAARELIQAKAAPGAAPRIERSPL